MMSRLVAIVAAGTVLAYSAMASAQGAGAPAAATDNEPHVISTQDLEMMRKDIRSQKKQLMAQNLTLSDTEATKFWPIYDQYVGELRKIKDKQYAMFQDYADRFGRLSDEQAESLIKQLLDVDVAAGQLRAKYLPLVSKAIGGKKAATWGQLDRRIQMMVDLQLSSKTPLVQAQSKPAAP
jgi:Spy/CpxP family protein refolding chaperone